MPVLRFSSIKREHQQALLKVARYAIEHYLSEQQRWQAEPEQYPTILQAPAASFVTLHKNAQLRGCIGTLEAYQALVQDVALHAYQAAFEDLRFAPLTLQELPLIHISISILSPSQALPPQLNEAALIARLRPNQDGLILAQGNKRAVFLPQVWQQLPNSNDFIQQLKRKGGWSLNSPVEKMRCFKFQVLEFGE
ncbi:AmmeMemoRadiSam system protein A [Agarivorans sp. QJM3NY_29]|uniref:AmmeMemoRadiSam system protein A n=1 Tax=unclassified Agarivorans TaxID=2636026 RepID=UPI003D7E8E8C